MRILFLSDEYPPHNAGGSGVIVKNLAESMSQAGHNVFVVTAVQEKKFTGTTKVNNLSIHSIFSKISPRFRAFTCINNRKIVRQVKQILAEVKPDVVHAHNLHEHLSYACLQVAKESGAKVFLTTHDVMLFHYGKLTEFLNKRNKIEYSSSYKISGIALFKRYGFRYNPLRNFFIKKYLKFTDGIFAVSKELGKALKQNSINKIVTIYNGVNTSDWKIEEAFVNNFKTNFGLKNKRIILYGGRISGLKGGWQACEMLAKISKNYPGATLLVAGKTNEYLKNITENAKEFGINQNIVPTGWLSKKDITAAYYSAEIVVVPSLYLDPFPTVNLEAMASKKPVVGTCFGGTPEIVKHGKTGYIVNPYNLEDFADKVSDLLKNPDRAKAFGHAGYERVKKHFSLHEMVENYLHYYQGKAK